MSSCTVYVQKSDFHLINVFCVVIVVTKCRLLCLAQVVFSYFALHSSKIPLVLTIKVIHLRSLLLRQPDGVNCAVRRVYFGVVPKQSSAVSGLWMLTVASTWCCSCLRRLELLRQAQEKDGNSWH